MLKENAVHSRELKTENLDGDLAIIGGGMAGTCCALTAARGPQSRAGARPSGAGRQRFE